MHSDADCWIQLFLKKQFALSCCSSQIDAKMSFSLQFLVFFCLTTCYGTVTTKLKILGRRNSGIFFEGETMTISCTVTNAVKTPKIIWFMSSERIIPDENKLINVTFNGTSALSILTLQKLNVKYRGHYLRCKDQKNDESSSNTDPLKIGRISVTKSSRQFLEYGNNETLTCSLSEGKPEDIGYLLWRKIPSEKVLKTVSNKAKLELHVEHVNGNNAGYYECVFKASNGNFFLTKSVEIKVVPSNPKKQQKETIYRIPNTVTLTCDIQGHPLTILWKVNCNSNSSGSHIYFNHTLVNENRTFVINETNEDSSGMFCCIGWNSAGKTKQFFSLKRPFDKNCGKNNGRKLRNGLDIIFFLILSHVML